jgi:hypothetical protein
VARTGHPGKARRLSRRSHHAVGLLPLLLFQWACRHNELAGPLDYSTGAPPSGVGAFHRATFNTGNDLSPSWQQGRSQIVYAYESDQDLVRDRCLATLPPAGGTRRQLACLPRVAGDSVVHSDWPAADASGHLAFVFEHLRPAPLIPIPDSARILLSSLSQPTDTAIGFRFPYREPGVRSYETATQLAWLSPDTLLAVGSRATIYRDCPTCVYRPVRQGREVILIDLRAVPGTLTIVPNTFAASGVAPGPSAATIYYTLAGDSRVYAQVLATGATTVVHDFAPDGIARDVSAGGNRLAVIVGGSVAYIDTPEIGPLQDDSGGTLHVYDLVAGTDSVLPDSGVLYRHPALSPSGSELVAEGWRNGQADLWYFHLP